MRKTGVACSLSHKCEAAHRLSDGGTDFFVTFTDTMISPGATEMQKRSASGRKRSVLKVMVSVNNDSGKTVFVKENLRRGSLLVIPRCQVKKDQKETDETYTNEP
jgi:hypothetical protein